MIDYLRHMAIFSYVAEKGSFSEAARALGIAPSRVSEAISKLEYHVGVTLLYRTTRQISLTSEGREFLTHVSSMVKNAENGLDLLNAGKREPCGTLEISAPSFLSHSPLVEAIAKFVDTHKKINVLMRFTDLDVHPIKDGFDLCICAGAVEHEGVTLRKLGTFDRSVVAGIGYAQQHSHPKHPMELKEWDWINYRHVKRTLRFRSNTGQKAQLFIEKQARLQVDNLDALVSFVEMNMGASVIPTEHARRGIEEGRLVRLVEDWRLIPVQYCAIWPESSIQNSLILVFVEFMKSCLSVKKV